VDLSMTNKIGGVQVALFIANVAITVLHALNVLIMHLAMALFNVFQPVLLIRICISATIPALVRY